MAMITTNFPDGLDRNFRAVFRYADQTQPARIAPFTVIPSSYNYEKESAITDLEQALVKPETVDLQYRDPVQGYDKTYTHSVIALGTKLSWELSNDLTQTAQVVAQRAEQLRQSLNWKISVDVANHFNNATAAGTLGPDGVPLCDASHPATGAGTRRNEIAAAAAFSYDSIEDTILALMQQTSWQGNVLGFAPPFTMVGRVGVTFDAFELLNSVNRPSIEYADGTTASAATAYNNANAMREMRMFDQVILNPYISLDATFIIAKGHKLRFFEAYSPTVMPGPVWDEDAMVWKYQAVARYSSGWSDWQHVYMLPHS